MRTASTWRTIGRRALPAGMLSRRIDASAKIGRRRISRGAMAPTMYDMLPRLRRGGVDQRRMKRGLAVAQVALRQDADHVVGVQVNRVGIRRRATTAAPAHDPRVPDATGCHDLLRKGAPDDFQFGLAI